MTKMRLRDVFRGTCLEWMLELILYGSYKEAGGFAKPPAVVFVGYSHERRGSVAVVQVLYVGFMSCHCFNASLRSEQLTEFTVCGVVNVPVEASNVVVGALPTAV